jgi:MurNAc alpha-1-phosphate uridylyltransferase
MADPIRFQPVSGRPDVMLLAAGLGRRLRPLTETQPKPLLEIGGVPLIDRVVAEAAAEGFCRFVVNTHHHAGRLAAHVDALAGRFPEARFRVSHEPELLETGGGLKQALPLLDTDPVLVMNTDTFWLPGVDQPLVRLLGRLPDADIVLLCAQPRRALGFRRSHDFCLDPRGQITRDSGQPVIYAGVALLRRALVEAVAETRFSLYPLFMAALEKRRLAGAMLDAEWFHVGDPEALAEVERRLAMAIA